MLQPTKQGENKMRKFLELISVVKKETTTRAQREQQRFSEEVKKQFVELKEKGLAIPIFTL